MSNQMIELLHDLFEADHNCGIGFHKDKKWLEAYAKLQRLVGYDKQTAVLDEGEDISELPDS